MADDVTVTDNDPEVLAHDLRAAAATTPDRPWLNDFATMDQVVRGFVSNVLNVEERYGRGESVLSAEEAKSETADLVEAAKTILAGGDPNYVASEFNTGPALRQYLRALRGFDDLNDDPLRMELYRIAGEAVTIARGLDDGKIDIDAAKFQTAALIEDSVYGFLGYPMPDEDAQDDSDQ